MLQRFIHDHDTSVSRVAILIIYEGKPGHDKKFYIQPSCYIMFYLLICGDVLFVALYGGHYLAYKV